MSAKGLGGGSLGNTASIASTLRPKGAKIEDFDKADRAAFSRLLRFQRLKGARRLLPAERVASCIWTPVSAYVEIWKTSKQAAADGVGARAHYRGVVTCGSVWMCPVCAAKISERRRLELAETIQAAREKGLTVFMVTLTLQHNKRERYLGLVESLRDAWRRVRSGRAWQTIQARYKIEGLVTALEFTVSLDNGGHPHLHVLVFSGLASCEVDSEALRADISNRYGDVLHRLGRYAHYKHGVMVQLGDDYVGDYVAKFGKEPESKSWGLDAEMTKGMVKSGAVQHGQHYTPFQLLDAYLLGDKKAGAMFVQYAVAFKGRHQIGGLSKVRRMLGLVDSMSDDEIAAAGVEDTSRFVQLLHKQWRIIRKGAGMTLEVANKSDYETFKKYLLSLGVHLDD